MLAADIELTVDDRDPGTDRTWFDHDGIWVENPHVLNTFQGDRLIARKGSVGATATWAFNHLEPGRYQIATTWQPQGNRSPQATYQVFRGNGLVTAFEVDQRTNPTADVLVGRGQKAFQWLSDEPLDVVGTELRVELSGDVFGDVVADAVHLRRVSDLAFTSDDRDATTEHTDFTRSTGWFDNPYPGISYGGDRWISQGGSGENTATWTFKNLAPGTYQVSASWQPHTYRSASATYVLSGDQGSAVSASVDQKNAPEAHVLVGDSLTAFEFLGAPISVAGDRLTVTLSNDGPGQVVADAVHIERLGNPTYTSDDGDDQPPYTSYQTVGQWGDNPYVSQTFQGDRDLASGGSGEKTATWAFANIAPGYYHVATTWQPNVDSRNPAAPYTIHRGDEVLATIHVDQRTGPESDVLVGADHTPFEYLGAPIYIDQRGLEVTLSNDGNNWVVADAVHLKPIAPPQIENRFLHVAEGDSVVLTSDNFSATPGDDLTGDEGPLTFTVSDVENGFFAATDAPGIPLERFTEGQIAMGEIQFLHDGGEEAPAFHLSVELGGVPSLAFPGWVSFENQNDRPEVLAGQTFYVSENALVGESIGTVEAFDSEGATLQDWLIVSGNEAGIFAVDPDSGQITVALADSLEFEDSPLYELELRVGDGLLYSYDTVVSIRIEDAIESSGVAKIAVNSFGDAVDATPAGDGIVDVDPFVDGHQVTLRAAIQEANAMQIAQGVEILLPAGSYSLDRLADPSAEENGLDTATGDLDILSRITLSGAADGATVIDATGVDTAFQLGDDPTSDSPLGQLTINGVHVVGVPIKSASLPALDSGTLLSTDQAALPLPAAADHLRPGALAPEIGAGVPIIAEHSDTAGPDQSLTLSGYLISTATENTAAMGNDTRVLVFGQSNHGQLVYRYADILRVDGSDALDATGNNAFQVAQVILPDDLPENSTYAIWVANANGWSAPLLVNRTEVWWGLGQTVNRGDVAGAVRTGDRIALHGRHLAFDQEWELGLTSIHVEARNSAGDLLGHGVVIEADPSIESNPFRVEFTAPTGAELGLGDTAAIDHFMVRAHNGKAGSLGWSTPTKILVNDSEPALLSDVGRIRLDVTDQAALDQVRGLIEAGNPQLADFELPAIVGDAEADEMNLEEQERRKIPGQNASTLIKLMSFLSSETRWNFRGIGSPGAHYTLHFPSGDYSFNREMKIYSDVVLEGAGAGLTRLIGVNRDSDGNDRDPDHEVRYFLYGPDADNVGIQDLSILAGKPGITDDGATTLENRLNVSSLLQFGYANRNGSHNIAIDSVEIHSDRDIAIRAPMTRNLSVTETKIVGFGSILDNVTQGRFADNQFRYRANANSAISFRNPSQISVTGSLALDDDNSRSSTTDGWGTGRFIVVASLGGASNDLYFAENRTMDAGLNSNRDLDIFANEGEQFLFEETQSALSAAAGDVISSDESQVSFRSRVVRSSESGTARPPSVGPNQTLLIVDGRGTGQYRTGEVVELDSQVAPDGYQFIPDEPWAIVPDETSVVVVTHVPQRAVVYNNWLDGKKEVMQATRRSAGYEKPVTSVGVAIADGGLDLVVDSNTIQQTNGGISVRGGDFGTPNGSANKDDFSMPAYWIRLSNNEIGVSPGEEERQVLGGINVASGGTDGGQPSLGIHVSGNEVETRTVDRLFQVIGQRDDPQNPVPGDPVDLSLSASGAGLSVSPFYSNSSSRTDGGAVAEHSGPSYVSFDGNVVKAAKGFSTSAYSRNTGPVGGRNYLVDGHSEHLVLYGNQFHSPEGPDGPISLAFNLVLDRSISEQNVPDDYHGNLTWGLNADVAPTENEVTPPLPADYRFHAVKDNLFHASRVDYQFGFLDGEAITRVDDLTGANDSGSPLLPSRVEEVLSQGVSAATLFRQTYQETRDTDAGYLTPVAGTNEVIAVDALRITRIGPQAARIGSIESDQEWLTVLGADAPSGPSTFSESIFEVFDLRFEKPSQEGISELVGNLTIEILDEVGTLLETLEVQVKFRLS